jgi:hypothetical protein
MLPAEKLQPDNPNWNTYEVQVSPEVAASILEEFLRWIDKLFLPGDQRSLPWSVLITERKLVPEWKKSPNSLPDWILAEFFRTVFIEKAVLTELSAIRPNVASRFEIDAQFGLYRYNWEAEKVSPQ